MKPSLTTVPIKNLNVNYSTFNSGLKVLILELYTLIVLGKYIYYCNPLSLSLINYQMRNSISGR